MPNLSVCRREYMGDTNGDKVADFRIELTGLHAMQANDFFL